VRLSAPLEVHACLTARCPTGCTACYVASGPGPHPDELDTAAWKTAIDELSAAGVFHLALGGGESVLRSDLLELAGYARERGLTPNLTTSGVGVTDAWARAAARRFGQIHVSLDGPESVDRASRGVDLFGTAVLALKRLRRYTRRVGINCVVSPLTLPHLDALGALARHLRVRSIELLRFKPVGRGATHAARLAPVSGLVERVLALRQRQGLRVRMDCSFVPWLAERGVEPALAARLGVTGCEGGNHLAAVRPDGRVLACSFWEQPEEGDVRSLRALWRRADAFEPFVSWADAPPVPCRDCDWLTVCRGGCRAVALHVTGDAHAPDPGCPRVLRA